MFLLFNLRSTSSVCLHSLKNNHLDEEAKKSLTETAKAKGMTVDL